MGGRQVGLGVVLVLGAIVGCESDQGDGSTLACTPGLDCAAMANGVGAGAGVGAAAGGPAGQPACLPNEQACPQGCVDVSSNPAHCGSCGFACAAGDICQAGVCTDVCGPGLGSCAGQCVNLASHPTHCGRCGNACPPGQLCVDGACSLSCDQTVCMGAAGPECVSLNDNRSHCGACNNACAQGDICAAGQCVLDCGMQTACNGVCVDLRSDNANCGACGMACPAGKVCDNAACACAPDLTQCGDACIDTSMDPQHCGACDRACEGGGLCEAGACVGPDGCTDTPVAGLSLSAVDAYQTVQIPIMQLGTAIGSGQRNADLVTGRQTVFRIHVTPAAAWTPREVSARVELTDVETPGADDAQLFFARLMPSGASSDEDLDSTFQVKVPAEAVGPDTGYAVTLVECDGAAGAPATGDAAAARFPATGFAPLEARETGPLKVHIIPISGTDVTEEGLEPFRERLEAVYPITQVEFTIGEPLTSFAGSMCTLLASVTTRRSEDNPPNDVYYYGLAPGILGGQSGCSNTSTGSRGSKVSAGWAEGFMPDNGRTGAATMCHEVGHAHGRFHAPCNVQDPDPGYPYPNADIGVWGYDARSDEFYEPTSKDMMSYCPEPRWAAWVSDYNYQAILERVVAVNAAPEVPEGGDAAGVPRTPWRLLVSDSAGVHWVEQPLLVRGTPEGIPVRAIVHGAHGPLQAIEVYKQDLEDGVREGAFMLTLPEPDQSWRAIELPGLLAPHPF